MKKNLSLIAISLISIITANAQKSPGIHIIKTFHIASAGGWDYLEVGPVNNRIYVSHGCIPFHLYSATTGLILHHHRAYVKILKITCKKKSRFFLTLPKTARC